MSKVVAERDALVAKKKERQRKRIHRYASPSEEGDGADSSQPSNVEEADEFEIDDGLGNDIDVDYVREGAASIQDLPLVIRKAELEEVLPEAMALLELAPKKPLTGVYGERVFSRLKRVFSASRSRMKQNRTEQLVLLQVEENTLGWVTGQPSFKDKVVVRFKEFNRRRFERFSRK